MAAVLRLIALFAALAACVASFAQTAPPKGAVNGTTGALVTAYGVGPGAPASVCSALAARGSNASESDSGAATGSGQTWNCTITHHYSNGGSDTDPGFGMSYVGQGLQCPGGATLQGGTECVCDSGFATADASACRESTNADCGPAGGTNGVPSEDQVFPVTEVAGSACTGGCKVKGGSTACAGGSCFLTGPYRNTGQACSSSNNTPPANATATSCAQQGQGVGTVNGVSVCAPATSSSTTTQATKVSTSASGVSSTSTQEKDVVNNGDGTSTTTTTTTNGDGSTSTTTTTGPTSVIGNNGAAPKSSGSSATAASGSSPTTDFCAAHPTSSVCITSSFGGSCGAAFTCNGDAVQCAIAQDQHQRNCQLFEPSTTGGDGAVQAQRGAQAVADGDHPSWSPSTPGNESSTTIDFSSQIDATNPFGSSCPADQVLPLVGAASVTIPFSSFCGSLQLAGALILGVAWLAAAGIVFKN